MPGTALPPSVRASMGLPPRNAKNDEYWKPGFGVAAQRGSSNGYHAGNQKIFLKKKSGVPMSQRASRKTQISNQHKEFRSTSTAVINVAKS